jgi:hypothetical protein
MKSTIYLKDEVIVHDKKTISSAPFYEVDIVMLGNNLVKGLFSIHDISKAISKYKKTQ